MKKSLKNLTSEEAFESIPEVISVLLKLKDSFLIREAMNYLHGLYRIADTKKHPCLEKI